MDQSAELAIVGSVCTRETVLRAEPVFAAKAPDESSLYNRAVRKVRWVRSPTPHMARKLIFLDLERT